MPSFQFDYLRNLGRRIFSATGIPVDDAVLISDHLVTNNLLGYDSHGIRFIPQYVSRLLDNYVSWEETNILRDAPSLSQFDGKGANGIVAVTRALDHVVDKALHSSIGMVGLQNVTHIGRLGDYPTRIAEKGTIGMVWMNGGGKFLAPFGSFERRLRPEPIAFAVPRSKGHPFVLDMTLSVVAAGKIHQKILLGESIPDGWLIDPEGQYVNEGSRYTDELESVGVLPLGDLAIKEKFVDPKELIQRGVSTENSHVSKCLKSNQKRLRG